MNRFRLVAVMAVGAAALGPGAGARAAVVEISVAGVGQAQGHVRVDLCTRDTFLKADCPYSGAAAAKTGSTLVRIADVSPGRYAVQAFHDRTDQGVVHQNAIGIPREPIGFSNDAPIRLRGPRFDEAAITVQNHVERVKITLRRLLGSSVIK